MWPANAAGTLRSLRVGGSPKANFRWQISSVIACAEDAQFAIHSVPNERSLAHVDVSLFCPTQLSTFKLLWLGGVLHKGPQNKTNPQSFYSVLTRTCSAQQTISRPVGPSPPGPRHVMCIC